jgi:RND family efflux transporter MFP subunit
MKFSALSYGLALMALCFPWSGLGAQVALPQGRSAPSGFDCIILPLQLVEIRSPQVGLIETMHVRRGASVHTGQPLVTLESNVERTATEASAFRSKAQGNLLLATNRVGAANEKSRRFIELFEEAYVSAQAKDDAVAELKIAQSEVKVAEEALALAKIEYRQAASQLDRRVLRSPISGVVMDVNASVGALVEPGESKKPILRVAQIDVLKVEATVPLQYFNEFPIGSKVSVLPEAPFDKAFTAKVKLRDRVIDPAAGTFGVIAEMDNRSQTLPGGLRCKLTFSR